jgi:TonB-dependent starch-binding outer membrane protein SusC
MAIAQERNIEGIITKDDREPLPGISIRIAGTTQGTTTDVDGKFSLGVVTTSTNY